MEEPKKDNKKEAAPPKRQRSTRPSHKGQRSRAQIKDEFSQHIISIRRVTRVVAGGRRFSFSVAIVVGDKKGRVGVGIGKASDTSLAINKAVRNAKKNMIKINMTKDGGIPHKAESKYCSARILMRPTKGSGLIAGSSVRNVLDLAGIKGVNAKVLSRSKNKLNNARAAILALKQMSI